MNKIKFSHDYTKQPFDIEHTKLLEVLKVDNLDRLHPEFIIYDTSTENKGERYQLPRGVPLLVLLLHSLQEDSMCWQLWTTIRRWTPEKEAYYRHMRGEQVDIVIESNTNI